jgi:hypothetical protein
VVISKGRHVFHLGLQGYVIARFANLILVNLEQDLLITAGYLTTVVCLMPFGLHDLKENITMQKVSFVLLCVMSAEFMYEFAQHNSETNTLPWFGTSYSQLAGTIVRIRNQHASKYLRRGAFQLRLPRYYSVLAVRKETQR